MSEMDSHTATARLLGWRAGRKAAEEVPLSDADAEDIVFGRIHEADLVDSYSHDHPVPDNAIVHEQVLGMGTGGYGWDGLPDRLADLVLQWDDSATSAWAHVLEVRAYEMVTESARRRLDNEEQKRIGMVAEALRGKGRGKS